MEIPIGKDPWVSFLYELMRDHVPCGVPEKLVQTEEEIRRGDQSLDAEMIANLRFTNKPLSVYAQELTHRLRQWDPMTRAVEERDKALRHIVQVLGPEMDCEDNQCAGCRHEMGEALKTAMKVLKMYDYPHRKDTGGSE